MSNVAFEIVIIVLLILLNGLLAMAEMAIVSARKARLQQRANEGDENARLALELANNPSDLLSTVQVGITLVGILAGAFGGATVAAPLAEVIAQIPALRPYSATISLAVVVVTITYLSLILGELAPKRVALNNAERVAAWVARPMRTLSRLATPLVRLLNASTNGVLRLFGARPSLEPPVTEEEINVLIEQGAEAGVFEEAEQDMVSAIFRLGDRRAGSLMTPRPEVVWLDLDDPFEINRRKIVESVHSRFPVGRGSLDNVVGILQAKRLLASNLDGQPPDLEKIVDEPLFVPENMPALQVLEIFRNAGVHGALVIDEFGGVQGLLTVNDVTEAIVGELPVLGEALEPEIVQRDDGSWLIDGMLPVDEFAAWFRLGALPGAEAGHFQTLGGFVMAQLGRVPEVGDSFGWGGMSFEVMDMDGLRVDKVLMSPQPEEKGR